MQNMRNKRNIRRSSSKSRRQRKRKRRFKLLIAVIAVVVVVLIIYFSFIRDTDSEETITYSVPSGISEDHTDISEDYSDISHSVEIEVEYMLLTPNEYSRPTTELSEVNGVVVHYTGNPGTTAVQNRDYFEDLKEGTDGTYASSHFIIGLDGEIIQCVPLNEIAYASNNRNGDTISIECCHPDESGEFTAATYESLVNLVTWLCEEFSLGSEDVIRHYDVTGKGCPKYFVDNESAWLAFQNTIAENLQ